MQFNKTIIRIQDGTQDITPSLYLHKTKEIRGNLKNRHTVTEIISGWSEQIMYSKQFHNPISWIFIGRS